MTVILAVGNSALASADQLIPANGSVLLTLINTAGGSIGGQAAPVSVDIKVGAIYMTQVQLTPNNSSAILTGGAATTYRVNRPAGGVDSVGVDAS